MSDTDRPIYSDLPNGYPPLAKSAVIYSDDIPM